MEAKISILRVFFEKPNSLFHIREIAKLTKINHTTVRKYLKQFEKDGYLTIKPTAPYTTYKANTTSKKYLNLKLYYNLEKIRESGLIENLEKHYNYPTIVLFGSYAKATDDEKSDLDICIISQTRSQINFKSYEAIIKRPISPHLFNKIQWAIAKQKNPNLINSICNGIVLSGQLEVP